MPTEYPKNWPEAEPLASLVGLAPVIIAPRVRGMVGVDARGRIGSVERPGNTPLFKVSYGYGVMTPEYDIELAGVDDSGVIHCSVANPDSIPLFFFYGVYTFATDGELMWRYGHHSGVGPFSMIGERLLPWDRLVGRHNSPPVCICKTWVHRKIKKWVSRHA